MFFGDHSESVNLFCMISMIARSAFYSCKSDTRRGFQPFRGSVQIFSAFGERVALVEISVASDTSSSHRPFFSCARPGTESRDQAQRQASSSDTHLPRCIYIRLIGGNYGSLGDAAAILSGLCSSRANNPGVSWVLTTAPCADLQDKPRLHFVVCDLDPWCIIIRMS
jgi:hypothetical protein